MKFVVDRQGCYQSFVLRLWREQEDAPWRAILQSTETEHSYHFATIDALMIFIEQLMDHGVVGATAEGSKE